MYILSKFAIALISPLGFSLFLGVLCLLVCVFNARRLGCWLGLFSIGWLGLWSMPAASDWLRASLEDPFPLVVMESVPQADVIVVLGGGVTPPRPGSNVPNLESGADRVWYGARLFLEGKAPLVLLSGGSDPEFSAMTEAEAMRSVLLSLGISDEAILLEGKSRNTTQNAYFSVETLSGKGVERVLLVTSALHMQRALALFEKAFAPMGIEVVSAATDHEVRPRPGWQAWLPSTVALDGSARAMKEWVGYWVGR